MIISMRQPTLQTLGLGNVLEIFLNKHLPANPTDLVDTVFGSGDDRGSLVISGANGIVGAGKTMQLGSRLQPYNVTTVGLDFPGSSDAINKHYPGLVRAFGRQSADQIMSNIVQLTYDGKHLPSELNGLKPRFLLEAIPEILELKKAHYDLFRESYPTMDIRSVTSGFPSSELGAGIAHPAFPHEINKVWEIVESQPSPFTQLLWSLGLIPIPVSDHWSFVLDVLFCGITLTGLRYHQATNMPYWKIDKYIRKHFGPNPFRAHDAIGAKGANFLTWSCLHDLDKQYGELFRPTEDLIEHKDSGQNWYPLNHFRPLVNWTIDGDEEENFLNWTEGALFQMASLMLHENRGHLSHINGIGELCAQFQQGILAMMRKMGSGAIIKRVEAYHNLHPEAAQCCWYPESFDQIESPEWQQLYVNAEHDGKIGVITISRESYNWDVDRELNRAIDWLKNEKIERVIVTGDFHLSTQMVGADTSEFFPALIDVETGFNVSSTWSQTARRLHNEFKVSVGYINGKRCLGGFLELMVHCHYIVSTNEANLGMPEVTLPVIPGMEGCHWPFRKANSADWPKLVRLLLTGKSILAKNAVGWLIDYSGTVDDSLQAALEIVSGNTDKFPQNKFVIEALKEIPIDVSLPASESPAMETTRKAILDTIQHSCSVPLSEALNIQARHSADFMISQVCKEGMIGSECAKIEDI